MLYGLHTHSEQHGEFLTSIAEAREPCGAAGSSRAMDGLTAAEAYNTFNHTEL